MRGVSHVQGDDMGGGASAISRLMVGGRGASAMFKVV